MYIALLVIVLLLGFVFHEYPAYRSVISSLIVFLLVFIAGFRFHVGMDYESYEEIFNDIRRGSETEVEIGYLMLCKACVAIGGTAQLVFLIASIVTIILIYDAYKRTSPNIILTLIIFICFGQMYLTIFNAIRQCIAVGIFAYSIKYIQNRQFIKYVVAVGLAASFHSTALLLFPLYWILNKKWSKKILIVIFFLVILSSGTIINIILNSPYAVYLFFENYSKEASIINYLYLFISFLIFLFSDKIMTRYMDRNIFLNINFISMLLYALYIVFSDSPIVMVVGRFNYYFVFFYAIIFVRILSDIRNKNVRFILKTGVLCFFVLMYLRTTILLGVRYHILPYQFNFKLF